MNNIRLTELNYVECARYLGYGDNTPDENIKAIMRECEAEILARAVPRFVYMVYDIEMVEDGVRLAGTDIVFHGDSVKAHLKECEKIVLLCVTLSETIDRCIRKAELLDMAKAVVLDAMATVAVEQACENATAHIHEVYEARYGKAYFTWRYGFGYGDLPLEEENIALRLLNTEKIIGVTLSDRLLMFPGKTTASIMGISSKQLEQKSKGCVTCNMKEKCKFRKRGNHCGF